MAKFYIHLSLMMIPFLNACNHPRSQAISTFDSMGCTSAVNVVFKDSTVKFNIDKTIEDIYFKNSSIPLDSFTFSFCNYKYKMVKNAIYQGKLLNNYFKRNNLDTHYHFINDLRYCVGNIYRLNNYLLIGFSYADCVGSSCLLLRNIVIDLNSKEHAYLESIGSIYINHINNKLYYVIWEKEPFDYPNMKNGIISGLRLGFFSKDGFKIEKTQYRIREYVFGDSITKLNDLKD